MSQITVGLSACVLMAGATMVARAWAVRPSGRRPLFLPDEPLSVTAGPSEHRVLGEGELARLLGDGDIEPLVSAACPCCDRWTAHARQPDEKLRCWTCGTRTPAGAS